MRNIKPHKGGRTDRLFVRLSPDEKAWIMRAKGGLSVSDFIMKMVEKQHKWAKKEIK